MIETGIMLLILFSGLFLQTDIFENIETIIVAVTGIFSLLLWHYLFRHTEKRAQKG